MSQLPILYSFRRCPYAIRARLALSVAEVEVEKREVRLRDKPPEMLAVSPKGTVPVMVLPSGEILEESLDIMLWALAQNDPESWLHSPTPSLKLIDLIERDFKPRLDGYKYGHRDSPEKMEACRREASEILSNLEVSMSKTALISDRPGLADFAVAPFVRQFANHDRFYFDTLGLPKLAGWLDSFVSSQRFVSIMEKQPRAAFT